jgi:hypothetical protein
MDALVKPHFSISGLLHASAMVSPVPVSILLAFASFAHGSSESTAASPMSINVSENIYITQPRSGVRQTDDAPDKAVRHLMANRQ